MKCINCEYEHEEAFEFCPICGTAQCGGFGDRVRAVVGSKAFLAICILITAAAALPLFSFSTVSLIDVLQILYVIFLWLSYSAAKKGGDLGGNLRLVSGAVYAEYIIVNVVSIIFMVGGVLFAAVSPIMSSIPYDTLMEEVEIAIDGMPADIMLPELTSETVGTLFLALGIGFVLVGALILVLNILSLKKIHRFAKSVYTSVQSGVPALEKVSAAKNWLMVIGAFGALDAVSSLAVDLPMGIASGCAAAAAIIASTLCRDFAE